MAISRVARRRVPPPQGLELTRTVRFSCLGFAAATGPAETHSWRPRCCRALDGMGPAAADLLGRGTLARALRGMRLGGPGLGSAGGLSLSVFGGFMLALSASAAMGP